MASKKEANRWRPLFMEFITQLRIDSKEVAATDDRGVELNLWRSQKMALDDIAAGLEDDVRMFLFLKSRQLGITTVTLAIDLFWLAIHPGTPGALVSDTEENSTVFRNILKRYMDSFPEQYLGASFSIESKYGGKNNKNFMLFSNGSRLDFLVAGTKSKATLGESRGYTLSHLCVARGTPVVTENGRIKPIEEIKIGTRVLTHTGKSAAVIDVLGQPNTKGPMIKISPWLGHALLCTDEHTIPTQRGLIEAKDVRKDDLLIMPVRPITREVFSITLPCTEVVAHKNTKAAGWVRVEAAASGAEIPITEEFGFAIGYYLAEGYMKKTSGRGKPCGLVFARHRSETAYADRAISALSLFTTGRRTTVDKTHCLTSVDSIYCTPLTMWIDENFGSLDDKIIPDKVFTWGQDFCRGLLIGLLSGDGSKGIVSAGHSKRKYSDRVTAKNGKKMGVPRTGPTDPTKRYAINYVVMPTTRSSIAMQARDIAASLGWGWGGIKHKAGGQWYGRNCKPCWRVSWSGIAARRMRGAMGLPVADRAGHDFTNKWEIRDGLVYLKIKSIETGFDEAEMWDISVDHEDHTFRTPYMSIGNTEIANYGNPVALRTFRETMAETHPHRLFIGESTGKGWNHYRDMWIEFGRDTLSKRRLFIGWWAKDINRIDPRDRRYEVYGMDPPSPEERELIQLVYEKYGWKINQDQLAWKRWRDSDTSSDESAQNQNQPWTEEQAFVITGYSFFQTRVLQKNMQHIYDEQPLYLGYRFWLGHEFSASTMEQIVDEALIGEIELRIWEEPRDDAEYVIGCDPAFGRNDWQDNHAVSVWRCYADRLVQVAEYADSRVETHQAAWVLAYIAAIYKNCMINLEITGPGRAILTEFNNLRAQMRSDEWMAKKAKDKKWTDFLDNARWYLYHRPDSMGAGYVYNWQTSWSNKFEIMNQLRDSYSQMFLDINSIQLLEEMTTVVQDGSTIEAPGRGKDDRVFSAALANRAWIDWVRPGMVARGATYERVTREQEGRSTAGQEIVDRIVHNFFRQAEANAESEAFTPEQKFLMDRGLG